MDLTRLRDKVQYCAQHQECLNERERGFIAQLEEGIRSRGDLFTVTAKQGVFLNMCLQDVLQSHPFQPASKLEQMRERKRLLDQRRDRALKRLRQSPRVHYKETAEIEVTARTRHGKTRQRASAEYIGTLRSQKPA